ncbi:MAG TPA: EAL domain-containing protein [Methylobacter sp.]|jgi:diguanylate cyclase (GGDEF)-like protein/PAS domain S-box-containing protein
MRKETIKKNPLWAETGGQPYHLLTGKCHTQDLLYELPQHQTELEIQNGELLRAHADLEESLDRYAELYDFAPVGYFILTHDGLIDEINSTALELIGVERKKLLHHHFSVFVTAAYADHWHLFFSNAKKHYERQNTWLTLKRSDGTEFPVQLDCRRVINADKNPVLYITLTDITESQLTERALHEVEMHTLSMALASAEMGSWDWDITTGRVIFNERWAKLRGYRLEDIEPHVDTWENGIHPNDFPAYHAALTAHLENRTPFFQAEYRVRTLTGPLIWISNRGTVIKRDSKGNPLHMAGIEIDITERKRNDEELRIAAIAFESQEGMIVTDSDAVIIRVNQAFTRLTGYTAKEAVGQTPHLLSSGRHDKAFYQQMWASLKEQGFWQGEVWNRRKNGMIYAEWLNISAVSAPDNTVTHYVASFADLTSNKEASAEIHRLAYYDPLTRLPNRRLFQEQLGKALAVSGRSGKYGALLFIDLDNFKSLNDALGHNMGDMLLTQVAMRLVDCIRKSDTVARQGGDEFVVMLEELSTNPEEAAIQAEEVGAKILAALNQIYHLSNYEYHSTPSIGVTLFNDHLETVDELLKRADIAMYAAKATGRNTLRFFDPEMQFAVTARAALEADLHRALAENQFKLYFQLQAHHDHQIIGAEVLLRWEHPERGLILPMEFIPLAEETKLILPIGLWVLEAACAQLKIWEDIPQTRHLQLAVNVSAHQFHQACFVEQVCALLEKYAIQPGRLKLELTESLVLDNIDDTIIKMQELKKIGVCSSMDDFGTGYSSLAYLTQLPLNQLKIDRSFVRNIGIKPTDAVIVQTIIGMANNLGMEVIAEGVETEDQRAFLELHGCSAIQGYLFGKPLPLDEFERSLGI